MIEESQLKELQEQLDIAERDVVFCRLSYKKKKHEFMDIETKLIEAREVVIKLTETIRVLKNERDIASTIDDTREAEIERFSKVLPDMLKRIEHEPRIPPVDILDDR